MVAGHQRRQWFVDPYLQGALLARCMIYWAMSLFSVFLGLVAWEAFTAPKQPFVLHFDEIWMKYGPVLLFALGLAPVMALDYLRLSNRFAGPMIRLRKTMRGLARGEHVEQVVLRRRDFWRDYADDLNQLVVRVHRMETELADLKAQAHAGGSDAPPHADSELVTS